MAEVGDRLVGRFARRPAERLGEPERVPGRLGEQETAETAPEPVRAAQERPPGYGESGVDGCEPRSKG
jgi:hypothetical protein